jgi:hypothetical protein
MLARLRLQGRRPSNPICSEGRWDSRGSLASVACPRGLRVPESWAPRFGRASQLDAERPKAKRRLIGAVDLHCKHAAGAVHQAIAGGRVQIAYAGVQALLEWGPGLWSQGRGSRRRWHVRLKCANGSAFSLRLLTGLCLLFRRFFASPALLRGSFAWNVGYRLAGRTSDFRGRGHIIRARMRQRRNVLE